MTICVARLRRGNLGHGHRLFLSHTRVLQRISAVGVSFASFSRRENRQAIFGRGGKIRNQEKGVFRRGFLQNVHLSWLWRSECQMYCRGQ